MKTLQKAPPLTIATQQKQSEDSILVRPLVTIIVPVYNAQEFLPLCLDSISRQTVQGIECICVDDGSTDASLKVLQEYAARDKRFRILTQPNQGPSAARNNGIDHASGEFVQFVDADDVIDADCCEKLLIKATTDSADLVVINAQVRLADEKTITRAAFRTLPKDKVDLTWLLIQCPGWSSIKFIKRSFFNNPNLRFPVGVHYGEDVVFSWRLGTCIHSFSVLDESLYTYYLRELPSLSKGNPKTLQTILLPMEIILEDIKQRESNATLMNLWFALKSRYLMICYKNQMQLSERDIAKAELRLFWNGISRDNRAKGLAHLGQSERLVVTAFYNGTINGKIIWRFIQPLLPRLLAGYRRVKSMLK